MARVERKDAAALEDATPDGRRGLIDGCGRRIDHLRLSVTSACDLRCTYCRPARISDEQTRGTTLADSQRVEFVKFLHEAYSLEQVRITGGEPLLYRGVVSLIDAIRRAVPGVALAMTTNGRLLPRTASALRRAGLARLNLSLDSLDADRYHEITGGRLEDVLAGFEAAQAAGFPPPRINAVVLRHVNDDEMGALVRWALARGSEIRFLEAMPIGPAAEANRRALVSASEIRAKLAETSR